MRNDFFAMYDALCTGVTGEEKIEKTITGERWAYAETASSAGIAMFTAGSTIAPLHATLECMSLDEAAQSVKSWNLEEASLGLAAVNAFYNTPARIEAFGAEVSMDVLQAGIVQLSWNLSSR